MTAVSSPHLGVAVLVHLHHPAAVALGEIPQAAPRHDPVAHREGLRRRGLRLQLTQLLLQRLQLLLTMSYII